MSHYECTRCGRDEEAARLEGCARGPCPMTLKSRFWEPVVFVALLALVGVAFGLVW